MLTFSLSNENSVNSTANQQGERERKQQISTLETQRLWGKFQTINKTLDSVVSRQFAWGGGQACVGACVKGSLCDATSKVDDGCCAGELRNRFPCPYGTGPIRSGTPCWFSNRGMTQRFYILTFFSFFFFFTVSVLIFSPSLTMGQLDL